MISIATGRSVSLGTGDQVAGDPAAEGVFAALTAPPRASAAVLTGNPDARVVLRDAGRPQAVLATAGALSHAVGLARSLPVSLAVYPAPSGAEVAVTVRPAAGGSDGGLVILQPVRPDHHHAARPRRDGTRPGRPGLVGVRPGAGLPERQHQRCTRAERLVRGRPHLHQPAPVVSRPLRHVRVVTGRPVGPVPGGAAGRNGSSPPRPAGRPAVARGPGFPVAWLP